MAEGIDDCKAVILLGVNCYRIARVVLIMLWLDIRIKFFIMIIMTPSHIHIVLDEWIAHKFHMGPFSLA